MTGESDQASAAMAEKDSIAAIVADLLGEVESWRYAYTDRKGCIDRADGGTVIYRASAATIERARAISADRASSGAHPERA